MPFMLIINDTMSPIDHIMTMNRWLRLQRSMIRYRKLLISRFAFIYSLYYFTLSVWCFYDMSLRWCCHFCLPFTRIWSGLCFADAWDIGTIMLLSIRAALRFRHYALMPARPLALMLLPFAQSRFLTFYLAKFCVSYRLYTHTTGPPPQRLWY